MTIYGDPKPYKKYRDKYKAELKAMSLDQLFEHAFEMQQADDYEGGFTDRQAYRSRYSQFYLRQRIYEGGGMLRPFTGEHPKEPTY